MPFYDVIAVVAADILAAQPRVPLYVAWLPVLALVLVAFVERHDDQWPLIRLLAIVGVAAGVLAIYLGWGIRRDRQDGQS